nr:hypothetical protein [Tanacetum cinerariifolium]
MRSIISMVSISLEGFLPSILLLVVIIVAVILVVVVIDAIVRVVIVVASIGVVVVVKIIRIVIVYGSVSHIIRLSFVHICASVSGPLVSDISFAMATTCASRAPATPFVISCRMVASVIAGLTDVDVLLGAIYQHIHANTKYRLSDNTGDGGKIAGKKTSMSKRYLVKLFEESGEMLPSEAEK